ncbi:MAG TPA: hypothetical protein VMB20_02925 [Candidatus Acidoferrum sp.]|nr:hypothetical protein [Candidatus Acidoferrum sp.]
MEGAIVTEAQQYAAVIAPLPIDFGSVFSGTLTIGIGSSGSISVPVSCLWEFSNNKTAVTIDQFTANSAARLTDLDAQ